MLKSLDSFKNSYPRCGPKSEMLKLEKNRISIIHKRIRNKPNRYKPINFLKKKTNLQKYVLEVLDSVFCLIGFFGTYFFLTYLIK
jgi:hypothetical protein